MTDTIRAVGSSAIVRRRVYFTMIEHPFSGWMRVGKAYGTRKTAPKTLACNLDSNAVSAWLQSRGQTAAQALEPVLLLSNKYF